MIMKEDMLKFIIAENHKNQIAIYIVIRHRKCKRSTLKPMFHKLNLIMMSKNGLDPNIAGLKKLLAQKNSGLKIMLTSKLCWPQKVLAAKKICWPQSAVCCLLAAKCWLMSISRHD